MRRGKRNCRKEQETREGEEGKGNRKKEGTAVTEGRIQQLSAQ